jgi:thiamine pyrophosphate-dependent acetolactate synthase large subunit-like protein
LLIAELAERFGIPVCGDVRGFPIKHSLHCGPGYEAIAPLDTDTLICIGARHMGTGYPENYVPARFADRVIAIGSDVSYFKNLQDVDLAILSDERRTLERLSSNTAEVNPSRFDERRNWARKQALAFRSDRLQATKSLENQGPHVRPSMLLNTLDSTLEKMGGAKIMIEQFALPIASLAGQEDPGNNVYMYAAGGSEGYGIGGTIGLKLGSPESRVVGLVGDGSLFYSDSGIWTAAHHKIPVLYVIPNNQSYGVVAGAFGNANGNMKSTGEYGGVVLEGIDPAKLSESFGIESDTVTEESRLNNALEHGLKVVDDEQRPFLLDVRLPLGLPKGGRPAKHFRFTGA